MNNSDLLDSNMLSAFPIDLQTKFLNWVENLVHDDLIGQTPVRIILTLILLSEANLLCDATEDENKLVYTYLCSNILSVELQEFIITVAANNIKRRLPTATKNQVATIISLSDNTGIQCSDLLLTVYPRWIADMYIKGLAVRSVLFAKRGNYNINLQELLEAISRGISD